MFLHCYCGAIDTSAQTIQAWKTDDLHYLSMKNLSVLLSHNLWRHRVGGEG